MPKVVDRDDRRRRLADAAIEVAARQGLAGVTVGGVAAEAGVSKGAVQHWFNSRQELLDEVAGVLRERIEHRVNAALPSTGSTRQAVTAALAALLPQDGAARRDLAAGRAFFTIALTDTEAGRTFRRGRALALDGLAALLGAVDSADRAALSARVLLGTVGYLGDAVILGELDYREAVGVLSCAVDRIVPAASPVGASTPGAGS